MSRISYELSALTPLGWREWVSFPGWRIDYINAKIDTGAKTSAIHAEDISFTDQAGRKMVEFTVYPRQKNNEDSTRVRAELLAFRNVRSSSGSLEKRPVILAEVIVAGIRFKTEFTLTNRSLMGFRMLLGRKALADHFMVISRRSYLGIKAPADIRRLNSRGN